MRSVAKIIDRMTLNERRTGDIVILDIDGRMTLQDGADTFRDAIRELIHQGRVKLVLNFHDTSYIDSSALGEIVRAHTSATREGGSLKLLNVPSRVRDLLVITKLLPVFALFDTEVEAVKSFGGWIW